MENPLVEFVYDEYQNCIEILRRKNVDYAGQNGGADPLANFRLSHSLGICTTDKAIFIRLLDKVARIATLLDKDPEVADECLADTIRDLCNYAMILSFALGEKHGRP